MEGTKNLAAAARNAGVKRFIHFSSVHALEQNPQGKPVDETRPLEESVTDTLEWFKKHQYL